MANNFYIPLQSKDFTNEVFRIIAMGEPGSILLPPNTGKSNRLVNIFIENNKSRLKDYHVVCFDVTFHEIEDSADFFGIIRNEKRMAKGKKIVFFLTNAQMLIYDNSYSLLNSMIDMQENDQNLQLIFLFSVDIIHPNIAKNIKTSIFSYIVYYPFYNHDDVIGLIDHQAKKWSISVSKEQKADIAKYCGGYFWLVKQALICLKDNPHLRIENILRYEGVRTALEQLYTSLSDSERKSLQDVIYDRKIEDEMEEHSFHYLTKIGLIKNNKVTIPLLASYLKNSLPQTKIEIVNNAIYVNSINIDRQFSRKEKQLFRTFILKKNQLITRDELAGSIWTNSSEESYSDWAIDRLVARLRKKIENLGIKEIIKTVRNQGYILTE